MENEKEISTLNKTNSPMLSHHVDSGLPEETMRSLPPIRKEQGNSPIEASEQQPNSKPQKHRNEHSSRSGKIKAFLNHVLEHWVVLTFSTIVTIYALFGDDIRQISTGKTGDNVFYVFHLLAFVIFSIEIILASYAKQGYLLSFFFWLDLISTLSLLLDVGWISDLFIGSGSSGNSATSTAQIARAARASRIGTRAGRIVRIFRLIRLIRIVKLYKNANEVAQRENNKENTAQVAPSPSQNLEGSMSMEVIPDGSPSRSPKTRKSALIKEDQTEKFSKQKIQEIMEESNVSKKLSDLTTKRVICLVMSILVSLPFFEPSIWAIVGVDVDVTGYDSGLNAIRMFQEKGMETDAALAWDFYTERYKGERNPLVYLEFNKFSDGKTIELDYFGSYSDVDDLRSTEQKVYLSPDDDEIDEDEDYFYLIAYFDTHKDEDFDSYMGIVRTIFVCVVLTVSSLIFSKTSQTLVLEPIEKMLKTVKLIAEDPLKAVDYEIEEALNWEEVFKKDKGAQKEFKEKQKYETALLENTLVKIGALLALGFGEAGSKIISKNISQGDGSVDPMIPGKKMMAIFGFCDIRNFTDATEVLQEGVMTFVNQIAEIVHGVVNDFSGAANKNIGDAFLMVWKIPDECIKEEGGNIFLEDEHPDPQVLADMALVSFVKIIAEVAKSPKLAVYKSHPGLNARLPNYSVKQGFGLHQGWAIEGAIGSEFKIDASYLSPNVNMAARLEAATKQFGVPLLISGALRNIMSERCRREMRHIDRVTVKGSIEPIDLYTCDTAPNKVSVARVSENSKMSDIQKKIIKHETNIRRSQRYNDACSDKISISSFFDQDPDIKAMRSPFTREFQDLFEKGIDLYLAGDWGKARQILEQTLVMLPGYRDGPSNTILEYMKEEKYTLPKGWNNYRELHEK